MTPAELLEPISAEQPSGEDPWSSAELTLLLQMRAQIGDGGLGATLETGETDWLGIAATAAVLKDKAKDLRVACWWTEAQVVVEGLDGLCAGLELLIGLVRQYWERGLHPSEDMEERSKLLEWLDRRLDRSIPGILLVKTEFASLTWGDAVGLEREVGSPQNNQLALLAWRVEPATYAHQAERAAAALALVRDLERALAGRLSPVTFGGTLGRLAEIQRFAASRYDTSEPQSEPDKEPDEPPREALFAQETPRPRDPWNECINVLRAGSFSLAEGPMIGALQTNPTPREVFLRKLETASIFLERERLSLARGILIGLMEQAEMHRLEHWESPELLARMWSLLYKSWQRITEAALRSWDKSTDSAEPRESPRE